MKMTPKKFYYVMAAAFTLSIVGGGAALYFANGLLQKQSKDVVELKLQNQELEAQEIAYRSAQKDVEKYDYLNEIIASALPQDKDQARTVREIFSMASAAGITIKSVSFPTSTLGIVTKGAATTPGATATTPAAAANAITQAVPVPGLNGVYGIATVVTPFADGKDYKVSYSQVIDLLSKIESNRRAMQVSDIQITPLGQNAADSVNFTLTLNIFIKP